LPQDLSEGGVNETPASVSEDVPSSNQEPKRRYWDAELLVKRPRKPNPKYIQLANRSMKVSLWLLVGCQHQSEQQHLTSTG
jgi:hypothetical protein